MCLRRPNPPRRHAFLLRQRRRPRARPRRCRRHGRRLPSCGRRQLPPRGNRPWSFPETCRKPLKERSDPRSKHTLFGRTSSSLLNRKGTVRVEPPCHVSAHTPAPPSPPARGGGGGRGRKTDSSGTGVEGGASVGG